MDFVHLLGLNDMPTNLELFTQELDDFLSSDVDAAEVFASDVGT